MASVVEICNGALGLIGVNDIVSLDDATKEAKACKLAWPLIRDEILRSHPWNCATKRASLSALTDSPLFEFDYQYQIPSDCLRIIKVHPDQEYTVEERRILSSSSTMNINYIFRQEDPTKYDVALVKAFTYCLAAEIAYQFTASTSLTDYLTTRSEELLSNARSADGREGTAEDPRPNTWLRAKYGYGGN